MPKSSRKTLTRILLVSFLLLLVIEVASFGGWIAYRRDATRLSCSQGVVGLIWSRAVESVPRTAWGGGRDAGPFYWRFQLPTWDTSTGDIRATVPLWPLLLATGAAALWTHRRSRRLPGHCPKCRYDLRATPPSAQGALTCPECGHTSPTPPAANNPLHEGPP